ncbi:Uma2 family endonuclease [Geobacillus icigianus]|nr:Uma2 family endonuclease [Geobacillus subterraneus]
MGPLGKERPPMTYKEYATWPEGKRCEVLDGNIISMAPSPTPEHQSISLQLSIEFGMYFRGKDCRVLAAPIDVYLFEDHRKGWMDENVRNWVCPDLVVICDKNKIQKNRIVGAPDLVIEILSPATAKIDRMDKRIAYERAGVKEYWIVDPANQVVEVYLREKTGKFELRGVYSRDDTVPVHGWEDLFIDLRNIFE